MNNAQFKSSSQRRSRRQQLRLHRLTSNRIYSFKALRRHRLALGVGPIADNHRSRALDPSAAHPDSGLLARQQIGDLG